jgi:ElaB/YqjD/DUF883 family membrane-anchored ribosome-binding protein
MNEVHTFPLPEIEIHKLDVWREQLPQDTDGLVMAADKWIRENALASTILAGALGYLMGRRLKKRG